MIIRGVFEQEGARERGVGGGNELELHILRVYQ